MRRVTIRHRSGTYDVTIRNDVGGTVTNVPAGEYEVEIVLTWIDYETGRRYMGKLLRHEDIEVMTALARTDLEPKDPTWDRTLVYFGSQAIVRKKGKK